MLCKDGEGEGEGYCDQALFESSYMYHKLTHCTTGGRMLCLVILMIMLSAWYNRIIKYNNRLSPALLWFWSGKREDLPGF